MAKARQYRLTSDGARIYLDPYEDPRYPFGTWLIGSTDGTRGRPMCAAVMVYMSMRRPPHERASDDWDRWHELLTRAERVVVDALSEHEREQFVIGRMAVPVELPPLFPREEK